MMRFDRLRAAMQQEHPQKCETCRRDEFLFVDGAPGALGRVQQEVDRINRVRRTHAQECGSPQPKAVALVSDAPRAIEGRLTGDGTHDGNLYYIAKEAEQS